MENYIDVDHDNVYLSDGESLDIIGVGDVRLKMSNMQVWKIKKIRHVPKLIRNMISVGQLDSNGHTTTFGSKLVEGDKGSYGCSLGLEVEHTLHDVEMPRYGCRGRQHREGQVVALQARAHERQGDKDASERRHDSRAEVGGTPYSRELYTQEAEAS